MARRVFVLVVAVCMFGACAQKRDVHLPLGNPAVTGSKETDDATLTVRLPKIVIGKKVPGFEVELKAKKKIQLNFTSGQRFDIDVIDSAGALAWRWSGQKNFIQSLRSETMKTGETKTYADNFWPTAKPGVYKVVAKITAADRQDLFVEQTLTIGI